MRGEGRVGLDVQSVPGVESCGFPAGEQVEDGSGDPGGDRAEKEPEKIFVIRAIPALWT